jgi:hypothetical protein
MTKPVESDKLYRASDKPKLAAGELTDQELDCPSSNGLGQTELFRDGGSGSFGLEFRRLSTDVAIVAV